MDGFSFCGVHCSTFGIGFVPSPEKRMQSTPSFKPITTTVTERPGGYWYGNQIDVRDFLLECYFEEIDLETYEGIYRWLHRDREGKLVFDDRPFVYYTVRPSKVIEGKIYTTTHSCGANTQTLYSGTITITFSAYDPFGKMSYIFYEENDLDGAEKHCGILSKEMMPEAPSASAGEFLLYNPGTEYADTVLRIGGSAPSGVTITNHTTGDKCVQITLPPSPDFIELDSDAGYVQQLPSLSDSFAFEYHEYGFIRLAPCTPYHRDVTIQYTNGSNQITFTSTIITQDYVGHYVRLSGDWRRIIAVTGNHTAIVDRAMPSDGIEKTMMAVMNHISISGENAELTKLEIEYIPRVR